MALTQHEDVTATPAPTGRAGSGFGRAISARASIALPLMVGGGTVWLTFRSGGYFAGDTAVAVIAAGLALLLWMMLAAHPLGGLSPSLAAAAGGLVLFAGWALVSQRWSHAPARAVTESDRTLLYALVVTLCGLASSSRLVRENVPRMVAAALIIVSACGLITRLLPDVWGISAETEFERLSYPVSYWNAQGMLAALAIVAAIYLATSGRERVVVRALAAAAVPVVSAALLLSFSRGAIAVVPLGVLVYLFLARPRHAASALLAILPTTAVAVAVVYRSNAIVEAVAPNPALVSDGKRAALVVAACAIAAAALLVVLAPVDERIARRWQPTPLVRRAVAATMIVAIVGGSLAAGVPRRVADRLHDLNHVELVPVTGDSRERLTDLGDNGRADAWRVALDAFERHPLAGTGAGTYPLLWSRHRRSEQELTDGHSLYLETMAEMGSVGLLLVVATIASLLVGSMLRLSVHRELAGLAFALTLIWAIRAGLDWDWEMPALTLPVLAVAAVSLYAPRREGHQRGRDRSWPNGLPRLLIGLALLAGLITPLAIVRSQARLNDAVADVHAGRCGPAIAAAIDANSALSIRPEPFSVLALCDLRAGRGDLALTASEAALRRDPDDWRLIYNRAIVRATLGRDPRPGLRDALRRNRRSWFLKIANWKFGSDDAKAWRRAGRKATLLL